MAAAWAFLHASDSLIYFVGHFVGSLEMGNYWWHHLYAHRPWIYPVYLCAQLPNESFGLDQPWDYCSDNISFYCGRRTFPGKQLAKEETIFDFVMSN